jgi:hypothetical protein
MKLALSPDLSEQEKNVVRVRKEITFFREMMCRKNCNLRLAYQIFEWQIRGKSLGLGSFGNFKKKEILQ